MKIADIDIFFLSYDEANAEKNWASLRRECPWAKRVHGVKGFDNAHKECARQSTTERFITVDGDNFVIPKFFTAEVEITDENKDCVFSWGGANAVNGLVYGNGGVKCWIRDYVMNMKSHESAVTEAGKVDFCWELKYKQMPESYSITYPNGSPFQAFRSGFREGVKMTLNEGNRVLPCQLDRLWGGNLQHLYVWCSVGADVKHGLWCMYGARLGAHMTNLSDWDVASISDYDWFSTFWSENIEPEYWAKDELWEEIVNLGNGLRKRLNMPIADLDAAGSRFFKATSEVKRMR